MDPLGSLPSRLWKVIALGLVLALGVAGLAVAERDPGAPSLTAERSTEDVTVPRWLFGDAGTFSIGERAAIAAGLQDRLDAQTARVRDLASTLPDATTSVGAQQVRDLASALQHATSSRPDDPIQSLVQLPAPVEPPADARGQGAEPVLQRAVEQAAEDVELAARQFGGTSFFCAFVFGILGQLFNLFSSFGFGSGSGFGSFQSPLNSIFGFLNLFDCPTPSPG